MVLSTLPRFRNITKVLFNHKEIRKYYSIFGLDDLLKPEKTQPSQPEFSLKPIQAHQHEEAMAVIKQHYLPEHVLVRDRKMDLTDDRAIDDYLITLMKQGNSFIAKADDGRVAGICVGFASSPVDARNLRSYAFYRQVCIPCRGYDCAQYSKVETQDQNVKDFLFFSAKLLETPDLWKTFKTEKIFEIKMLAVVPDFRRQGLGTQLVDSCKSQANDQGYHVVRMDCINPFDYKVAERCMLHCIAKFPLHKLRGPSSPFVDRTSPYHCSVRVYVDAKPQPDAPDLKSVKQRRHELESLIE